MTQFSGEQTKSDNAALKLSDITYFAPKRKKKNEASSTTTKRGNKGDDVRQIHAIHPV
ncbi:hypothetical protein KSF_105410 [Reticulibacter mediterranei]|uniref:Uncharacterized protein n=1 Tax=Reticulibacter mediterranei TaxID=2778369 RepID=A0A8J3N990_9CHLR|nr:hypothetical protein KSF_105410 [Reticulibacter mediterranei]